MSGSSHNPSTHHAKRHANRVHFDRAGDKHLPRRRYRSPSPKPLSRRNVQAQINKGLKYIEKLSKSFIIQWLVRKKWTSHTSSQLQRFSVEQLRHLFRDKLLEHGTIQDMQKIEDNVLGTYIQSYKKQSEQALQKQQERKKLLEWASTAFKVGTTVYIFDERYSVSQKRFVFIPIRAQIIKTSRGFRHITVRIMECRPWYEAGGWFVFNDQTMQFNFDRTTMKWLREGMTAEVCRSYDEQGKLVYFKLPHTRQYLITNISSPPSS